MDFDFSDPMDWALYGGLAAVVVLMSIVSRRHRSRLSRWAAQNGFDYSGSERFPTSGQTRWKYTLDGRHDDVWFRKYAEFYPFDTPDTQTVHELLVKSEDGLEWRVFRLNVDDSAEGSGSWYWVCVVEGPFDFPALQVRPVGFKDKLAGLFGKRDIETGLGEFDDMFHVSGESETFARDFLDSGMKRFLMKEGTFRWQVRGPHAMLVWPQSYDVKDVELMLFAMRRFVTQCQS